jgi:murein L,D-transpeptidase YcbB/YkuD
VQLPAQALLRVNAQLREKASTESASKMILRKGSQVTVLTANQFWLYVQYGNFHGYLRSDLIDMATLVSVAPGMHRKTAGDDDAAPARMLHIGSRGTAVKNLQADLLALGYAEVGATDGVFGKQTRAAVERFQRDHNLSADGIVGPQTFAMLDAEFE